jgi:aminoglycoside phosphotransferase (APT) family kinase protein
MELLSESAHMHSSAADFCKQILTADSLVQVLKKLHSIPA